MIGLLLRESAIASLPCAALPGLARQHEGLRDYPAALESMRRALGFNPFQEDLQRDVMRLLYLNGDRTGVIRQYESLRKLLDEEMGVPPMPETRDLYDAIINDTFVPSPTYALTQISPARSRSGGGTPTLLRSGGGA